MSKYDSIESVINDIANGKMAIIVDDQDRENEGDLIMAAEMIRPEDINFMARFGRGLICLTLTESRCRELRLPLMVESTYRDRRTNFTVSVEAAEGVTTGISAQDRAHTIRTVVSANTRPEDLRHPGHVFPLMAQPGGVLTRAGHTEAGCDLARLAGFAPASVIVEIMNDDGTMARRSDLIRFSAEHRLRIGTIADLIRHRLKNEHTVTRTAERMIDTESGQFLAVAFRDEVHNDLHLALVYGNPSEVRSPLVRVHLTDTARDLIALSNRRHHWSLKSAMERIAQEGTGVIVILRNHESSTELQDSIFSPNEPVLSASDASPVIRSYGIGAQILRHLGITRMRVLSSPQHLISIEAFGLVIESYVSREP